MQAGIHTECFVEKLMEVDYPRMGILEVQRAYVAGAMLEAGMGRDSDPIPKIGRVDKVGPDTTQLSLNSIISGLIAVTKAHEELVGDRMPIFEDSPNLPYIRAMVKEVLRWRSVPNSGITHVFTVLDG